METCCSPQQIRMSKMSVLSPSCLSQLLTPARFRQYAFRSDIETIRLFMFWMDIIWSQLSRSESPWHKNYIPNNTALLPMKWLSLVHISIFEWRCIFVSDLSEYSHLVSTESSSTETKQILVLRWLRLWTNYPNPNYTRHRQENALTYHSSEQTN